MGSEQKTGSITGRSVEPENDNLHAHYKGMRKEKQVENLLIAGIAIETASEKYETADGINAFDEFDNMAARDWVKALIASEDNRKALDKLNNQIQTVPTDDYIHMLCGIEMLADLLGAKLQKVSPEDGIFNYLYFDFQGKRFFQFQRTR